MTPGLHILHTKMTHRITESSNLGTTSAGYHRKSHHIVMSTNLEDDPKRKEYRTRILDIMVLTRGTTLADYLKRPHHIEVSSRLNHTTQTENPIRSHHKLVSPSLIDGMT